VSFPGTQLLEMVGELHRRGLERLRITPFMAPSGIHWRLAISASDCAQVARYTTADDTRYYGWTESPDATPADLADLFVERFADLARSGRGNDPEYAAWLRLVLDVVRQGWVPYFYADWEPDPEIEGVPLASVVARDDVPPVLPEPPGGLPR
jgi:hypothetical protein